MDEDRVTWLVVRLICETITGEEKEELAKLAKQNPRLSKYLQQIQDPAIMEKDLDKLNPPEDWHLITRTGGSASVERLKRILRAIFLFPTDHKG